MRQRHQPRVDRRPWTIEQDETWLLCRAGIPPNPSDGQTSEQAFNFAVDSFTQACYFEGVEPPPRDRVEQRMRSEFPNPPVT